MNTQSTRHRPTPLSASVSGSYNVPPAAQRSARSSRNSITPTLQTSQQEYLMQLQNQVAQQTAMQNALILQQVLVQQQQEAEQVLRQMVGTAQQPPQQIMSQPSAHYLGASHGFQEDSEQVAARNPLVASALARRKRQSLNSEVMQNLSQPAEQNRFHGRPTSAEQNSSRYHSQTQPFQQTGYTREAGRAQHHRRHSSGITFSSASSSSPLKTPPATSDPPALILTQPGEEYPNTSSSGSESGDVQTKVKTSRPSASLHARNDSNSSKASSADSVEIITNKLQNGSINEKKSRRISHIGTLESALSARRNRTVTETLTTALPNSALSPFANTFTPTPTSPQIATSPKFEYSYETNESNWVSSKPPPAAGTATAIRQPKGPAAEMAGNFNARLRRQAVLTLTNRRAAPAESIE